MPRFVAYGAAYSHGVQSEISEPTPTGARITRRGLEAQFWQRGIKERDIEIGAKLLQIHGLPEDRIEGGEVSPMSRMSVFDPAIAGAEAAPLPWTEDEIDLVTQKLRESDRYGLDFVEIEEERLATPWAGYDKLDADKVLAAVEATGVNPVDVIAYENQNANRVELIARLYDLVGTESTEAPVTIDAS